MRRLVCFCSAFSSAIVYVNQGILIRRSHWGFLLRNRPCASFLIFSSDGDMCVRVEGAPLADSDVGGSVWEHQLGITGLRPHVLRRRRENVDSEKIALELEIASGSIKAQSIMRHFAPRAYYSGAISLFSYVIQKVGI